MKIYSIYAVVIDIDTLQEKNVEYATLVCSELKDVYNEQEYQELQKLLDKGVIKGLGVVQLKQGNQGNVHEPTYHTRKCDVTGEGMDCGWVCGDDYYIKYEEDLIKHLREVYKSENLNGDDELTDDELREKYYEECYFYYTEWDTDEDIMYIEVDGKVRLMKADDYKIKELNK